MKTSCLMGAICGDIIGSVYQFDPTKEKDFPLFSRSCEFTDDTVMTLAVAKTFVESSHPVDLDDFKRTLIANMHEFGEKYPEVGYGHRFLQWLDSGSVEPYNSCGNGSAMRVSAVGWYARTLEEAETLAEASAEVTHNHPDGIAGAVAVAGAIYLAKTGESKATIREYVSRYYDLDFTLDEIRPGYDFRSCCDGSIQPAVAAFLESDSYEQTVRNAISLGGDADTLGAIAGSIAEAYFGIPDDIVDAAVTYLDDYLLDVAQEFSQCLEYLD